MKEGRLPRFPRYTSVESVRDIVRPAERDIDTLPLWFPVRILEYNLSGVDRTSLIIVCSFELVLVFHHR